MIERVFVGVTKLWCVVQIILRKSLARLICPINLDTPAVLKIMVKYTLSIISLFKVLNMLNVCATCALPIQGGNDKKK